MLDTGLPTGGLKGGTMRTIIAGSRGWTDKQSLVQAIAMCGWPVTTILSGGAKGADRLGEAWAKTHGIPLELYLADWDTWGKSAGYRRNLQMAANAEALIALWNGKSRGTAHMINIAHNAGLPVYVLTRR